MALSQSSKILVSDINSALAGKQDALGYTPVKSVNGTSADSSGNVTVNATPSTVKGVLGSAWAANGTSMTLPSGGTWFVWNVADVTLSNSSYNGGYGYNYGVGSGSATSSNYSSVAGTYAGGTAIYAKQRTSDDGKYSYSANGKLAAIRIA